MDKSLKRILAFILDILIVTTFVTVITKYTNIDPFKEKYTEVYNKYEEIIEDDISSLTKDKMIEINYELYEYRVVNNAITITSILIYFGVIQYLLKGQTVGKKMLNIKTVGKDGKKLSAFNYLLRAFILNNSIFAIISIACVFMMSGKTFYYTTYVVSLVESVVYLINVLMVVVRKNGRGLHDIISGTEVIDLKTPVEEANKEVKVEKVVEAEVVEEPKIVKTSPAKKTATKKSSAKKSTTAKKATTTKKATATKKTATKKTTTKKTATKKTTK